MYARRKLESNPLLCDFRTTTLSSEPLDKVTGTNVKQKEGVTKERARNQ